VLLLQLAFFWPHDVGGDGDGGVGEGAVGPLAKHTRFAGLPPEHELEQQSVLTVHDSSTWAKPQAVGALVGAWVGAGVGSAVVGLFVGLSDTVGAGVGRRVGLFVGLSDTVGAGVGRRVGLFVGLSDTVGAGVGGGDTEPYVISTGAKPVVKLIVPTVTVTVLLPRTPVKVPPLPILLNKVD